MKDKDHQPNEPPFTVTTSDAAATVIIDETPATAVPAKRGKADADQA